MANAADAELVLSSTNFGRRRPYARRDGFRVRLQSEDRGGIAGCVARHEVGVQPYWRQAMSFWEMAHSMVLRGALDADLFLDSNLEGFLSTRSFTTSTPRRRRRAGTHYGADSCSDCEIPGGKGTL